MVILEGTGYGHLKSIPWCGGFICQQSVSVTLSQVQISLPDVCLVKVQVNWALNEISWHFGTCKISELFEI